MSSATASTSTAPGPNPGGSAGSGGSSRPVLGPAWYRGGGGHGNRGFQPPPAVSSEGRSGEEQRIENEGKNINGNDDEHIQHGVNKHMEAELDKKNRSGSFSSRSEGLLSGAGNRGGSYPRTSPAPYAGKKSTGRSLADLVASKPNSTMSRTQSSGAPYRNDGSRVSGGDRNNDDVDKKPVIRFTRERLLSLRPQPDPKVEGLPSFLKHLLGTVVLSNVPQEPVCFDDFNADEIWAQPSRPRAANPTQKTSSLRTLSDTNRPESTDNSRQNGGRWQRGVALPSEREKRQDDATTPEELWDDPVNNNEDLSQYGGPIDDLRRSRENSVTSNTSNSEKAGPLLDWKDISDATSRFDHEIHSNNKPAVAVPIEEEKEEKEELDDNGYVSKPVDQHKPLASAGTTIQSGSGEDVNVFEDFGEPAPSEPSSPPPTTTAVPSTATVPEKKTEPSELSASSRLMQMIGISVPDDTAGSSKLITSWGSSNVKDVSSSSEVSSFGTGGGFIGSCPSSSVPKNPWGTALVQPISSEPTSMPNSDGFDLAARLEAAVAEQKTREAKAVAEAAVEDQRRRELDQRQQELLRRQKEEEDEAQRIQTLLRAQLSAQHAAQQAHQAAEAQRQAAAAQAAASVGRVQYNSQVEAILLERISTVLENSWGRVDLMAILSTLHMEDARVIPLLGSMEALKALLSRHPQRFALAKEPQYGVDVAILILSNAQWNQQKAQQEELHRQQHMQAAQAAAQAQVEAKAAQTAAQALQPSCNIKVTNAPWFYADPHGNIQGPFGGEEMRQWLDAGYFKGDLPVSQNPKGPFRSLLSIFPDPAVAFHVNQSSDEEENEKDKFPENKLLVESEKNEIETPIPTSSDTENEHTELTESNTPLTENANSLPAVMTSPDQNASSVQLKMLLGLSGFNSKPSSNESEIETSTDIGVGIAGPPPVQESSPIKEEKVETPPPEIILSPPQASQSSSKQQQHHHKQSQHTKSRRETPVPAPTLVQVTKAPSPTPIVPPVLLPSPAPVAWGGAATNKATRKKSMSEIQQEEARVAAILAKERQSISRSSSGGWANIAASGGGSSGWSSGTVKQSNPSVVLAAAPQAKAIKPQQPNQKQLPQQQSHHQGSNSQSKAVDDFGASMTPALESWCKDKMQKLTGSDDLTLISFCMTLNDPVEIRQYLAAYLGSTPEVSNFANDFIHRKGGSKGNQEEWESADKAKKSRKKKVSATK